MSTDFIELTGLLAQSAASGASAGSGAPANKRLTLVLVERLDTPGWGALPDASYRRLFEAAPSRGGRYLTPYRLADGGRPDHDGVRGQCWVTLDYRGRGAKDKKRRVLALADELWNAEVMVTARPKRYSFVDRRGEQVAGTLLQLVALERLRPK